MDITKGGTQMKRFAVGAAVTVALALAGATAALAVTVGPPQIDAANATIVVKPAAFKAIQCVGADGYPYVTYRGSWSGSETDASPGSTPYNLSGPWAVSGIVWTINLKTDRGVFHGTATFKSQPAVGGPTVKTYEGPITLITQGLPDSGNGAQARGWTSASTYTASALDGGSILANLEFQIAPNFSANGEFGATMGFNDLSVWTNNLVC
jgi:hypothetical protein